MEKQIEAKPTMGSKESSILMVWLFEFEYPNIQGKNRWSKEQNAAIFTKIIFLSHNSNKTQNFKNGILINDIVINFMCMYVIVIILYWLSSPNFIKNEN